MTQFSANLGFLWNDIALPDAIRAAKANGFDAVECHWPYAVATNDVVAALDETGLKMLGLNTVRGNAEAGEAGLCALPGREADARAAIEQAVTYAAVTGTYNVHVMAGYASGPQAHDAFVGNLRFAAEFAAPRGVGLLIEPLNRYDNPGYFLNGTEQASAIIAEVNSDSLKMMFDCYHVQLLEGDLFNRLKRLMPIIGHIQFAGVPDRGAPDRGELNYAEIFRHIDALGWDVPLGAEYKTGGNTEASLGWMQKLA